MNYIYAHATKVFALDSNLQVLESHDLDATAIKAISSYQVTSIEAELAKKHQAVLVNAKKENSAIIDVETLAKIHVAVTAGMPPTLIYDEICSDAITNSIDWDLFVIAAIHSVEELDKTINLHAKRLREWFEWGNPEFSRSIPDHQKFAEMVSTSTQDSLHPRHVLAETDYAQIQILATSLVQLFALREVQQNYVLNEMNQHLPNFTLIAGSQIGAKLLAIAGSAKNLVKMTGSTIQVLGAEKALFRHLKTGAKPPKYGVLYQHGLVAKCKDQGGMARRIANSLTIAVKADYFKGSKDVGAQLLVKLEGGSQ
jgi:RNA processing factor Prp31